MRGVISDPYQAVSQLSVYQDLNVLARDRPCPGKLGHRLGSERVKTAQNPPAACGRRLVPMHVLRHGSQPVEQSRRFVKQPQQRFRLGLLHDNNVIILTIYLSLFRGSTKPQ